MGWSLEGHVGARRDTGQGGPGLPHGGPDGWHHTGRFRLTEPGVPVQIARCSDPPTRDSIVPHAESRRQAT